MKNGVHVSLTTTISSSYDAHVCTYIHVHTYMHVFMHSTCVCARVCCVYVEGEGGGTPCAGCTQNEMDGGEARPGTLMRLFTTKTRFLLAFLTVFSFLSLLLSPALSLLLLPSPFSYFLNLFIPFFSFSLFALFLFMSISIFNLYFYHNFFYLSIYII